MTTSRPAWHVATWPPLGWLETAIKLVALGVGIDALLRAGGGTATIDGRRLIEIIVLAALCLGLVGAIADRLSSREIVAMVFVLVNNIGHLAMLAALFFHADADGHLLLFAALMLVGDLVKLGFLASSGFRVRDVPQSVLYGLTAAYVVGYAALIALAA